MHLFHRQTPQELVQKWRASVRAQDRQLDRQIRGIDGEEQKVKKALKEAAKKGNRGVMVSLAKEILRARKAKDRIHTSKAQLNSISMQLQNQLAQVKIAGTLQKSSEVMKMVNNLVRLPEISRDMQELQKEMTKAGVIEEMMEDSMQLGDEDEIEDEAEGEVEKVLTELTQGLLYSLSYYRMCQSCFSFRHLERGRKGRR